MIPLAIPLLNGNEARYLAACIETGFVSSVGPFVSRFETLIMEATGAAAASVTSAGTTGLHVALVAIGVRPGDLVVMPDFTFIASANAVSHCGAAPWLMDIEMDSWGLDPRYLEERLTRETHRDGDKLLHTASGRRVAAIMPVYILGSIPDMDAICRVAKAFGLPVVADAAAAIGSFYRGRPLAQAGADLSVLSFNGNKTITSGGGGAVIGSNEALVARVRHLCSTARVGVDYDHDEIGFNYRMTNVEAAVGCAQIERLSEFVAAKRRIRDTYNDALGDLPGIGKFPDPAWAQSACWLSGIVLDRRYHMPAIRARLRDQGIDAKPFWKVISQQPPYVEAVASATPVASDLWPRVLTLPSSSGLTIDEQSLVIGAVHDALHAEQ